MEIKSTTTPTAITQSDYTWLSLRHYQHNFFGRSICSDRYIILFAALFLPSLCFLTASGFWIGLEQSLVPSVPSIRFCSDSEGLKPSATNSEGQGSLLGMEVCLIFSVFPVMECMLSPLRWV